MKDFESQLAARIVNEREQNGNFQDEEDFISRTGIGREQAVLLIRAGALRFTGKTKAELLWNAHILVSKKQEEVKKQKLFHESSSRKFQLPEFSQHPLEDAYDEIEILGFPVTFSYFDMLETSFRGEAFASDMSNHVGKEVRMVGRLVTIKYVRTVKKEIMNFAAFTDVYGEFFDTVHFPDALRHYPFRGEGIYLLLGKIVEEFGFASMEVQKMAKLPLEPDPREK
jgi:DNA polymerase-3 subunit alpha